MLQHVLAMWTVTGHATTTTCTVLAGQNAFRVVVTVDDDALADESYETSAGALDRAEKLRVFLLAQGFDEASSRRVTLH